MTSLRIAAAAAVLALAASSAHADDTSDASRWTVHIGPAEVISQASGKVSAAGFPVPGANVSLGDEASLEAEVGYALTRNLSIAVATGFPPTFTVKGAGTIAPLGVVNRMTGGPSAVLMQWHFNRDGRIQPYVGAGAAFLTVFNTKDGALSNVKADNAVGAALQAGVDAMIDKHWGLYFDVKKGFISTTSTGSLGPAPVVAKVELDPVIPSFGAAYRF
jgi:outer membrane protein